MVIGQESLATEAQREIGASWNFISLPYLEILSSTGCCDKR
jgi:hypothetical protein